MRYDQRFSTSAMPHLGQLPDLSCTTSGCILHVYLTACPPPCVEDSFLQPVAPMAMTAIAATANAAMMSLDVFMLNRLWSEVIGSRVTFQQPAEVLAQKFSSAVNPRLHRFGCAVENHADFRVR